MRITGGAKRGRKLATLKGAGEIIRPTSDRVREAVFNILGNKVSGSRVMDLYAGSGALGIEAMSRGAELVVLVEQSREASRIIHSNLCACFPAPQALLLRQRLPSPRLRLLLEKKLAPGCSFDLIFMDPPYRKNLVGGTLAMIEEAELLAPGGMVIVEEHHNVALPRTTRTLTLSDQRRYGETGIWMYSLRPDLQPINLQ